MLLFRSMPDNIMMENHHSPPTTATRQPDRSLTPPARRLDQCIVIVQYSLSSGPQRNNNKKKTPSQNQRSDHTFPPNPFPSQRARKKSAADRATRRDRASSMEDNSATTSSIHPLRFGCVAFPCRTLLVNSIHRSLSPETFGRYLPYLPIAKSQ